jgi:hypothetical protein
MSTPGPRIDAVPMHVFIEMLDVIAAKLENGENPDVLAHYIRRVIAACERNQAS